MLQRALKFHGHAFHIGAVEDVKESIVRIINLPYDPYGNIGDGKSNHFRTVGINHWQTAILQNSRPNRPHDTTGIQWVSYGVNAFYNGCSILYTSGHNAFIFRQ